MKQRTTSVPVLVFVAVVALVLGSIGTAVAGPAITKKKVKSIATKVVKKQAAGLSVANAATAGNANALGGQPPGAYLNQTVFVADDSNVPLPAGVTTQISLANINVPAGHAFIHVIGETTFNGGNTVLSFWYSVDAACNASAAANPAYATRTWASSQPTQQSATVNQGAAVTPGAHVVRLCANASADSDAYRTQLSVETVQAGSVQVLGPVASSGAPGNSPR